MQQQRMTMYGEDERSLAASMWNKQSLFHLVLTNPAENTARYLAVLSDAYSTLCLIFRLRLMCTVPCILFLFSLLILRLCTWLPREQYGTTYLLLVLLYIRILVSALISTLVLLHHKVTLLYTLTRMQTHTPVRIYTAAMPRASS